MSYLVDTNVLLRSVQGPTPPLAPKLYSATKTDEQIHQSYAAYRGDRFAQLRANRDG